jgi:hypothetical protein
VLREYERAGKAELLTALKGALGNENTSLPYAELAERTDGWRPTSRDEGGD